MITIYIFLDIDSNVKDFSQEKNRDWISLLDRHYKWKFDIKKVSLWDDNSVILNQ